jgi:hypothetical protein
MDAAEIHGTPLIDGPDRFEPVRALGSDNTVFCRGARFRVVAGRSR